jgi:glycosyltransferase involved in cell wall biosynthesis
MRILHLNKMDSGGGAADGFMRIHRALLKSGHDSVAYVLKPQNPEGITLDVKKLLKPWSKLQWGAGRAYAKLKRVGQKASGVYDFDIEANFPAETIIKHARQHGPVDFILVHWAAGFLRPEAIEQISHALRAPVGLWQVDMAHMTGGCHYAIGCDRYQTGCGACPLLASQDPQDISAQQAATRRSVWQRLKPLLLSPSSWSAQQAQASKILQGLPEAIIPIPLDLKRFRPGQALAARQELNLPLDRRIFLVRGTHPNITYKGFQVFQKALEHLATLAPALPYKIHVIVAGTTGLLPKNMGSITTSDLGPLVGDQALARAYQACDVFVSPSIHDAGPMMVGEAMLCGRPVVAFPVGIAVDLVKHAQTGELAAPIGDANALAQVMARYATLSSQELEAQQAQASALAEKVFSSTYFQTALVAAIEKYRSQQ